jgi:hypothetical protein
MTKDGLHRFTDECPDRAEVLKNVFKVPLAVFFYHLNYSLLLVERFNPLQNQQQKVILEKLLRSSSRQQPGRVAGAHDLRGG